MQVLSRAAMGTSGNPRKKTFDVMLQILEKDYHRKHKMDGRPPKLSVLDKLKIMLQYYRGYRVVEMAINGAGTRGTGRVLGTVHIRQDVI